MFLYPNAYFEKVEDITIQFLIKNKIKALILDVDNTLIDKTEKLSQDIIDWAKNLKGQGVKLYILSNTNRKKKVEKIAEKLEIPFHYFGMKPLKRGFNKVKKELKEESSRIAVVGDQIFTDIIGGNRSKMFTILVDPIAEKDIWITRIKRPIENAIKNKYKKLCQNNEGRGVW